MSEKRFTIFGEWHKDCVIDEIRDNTGEYVTIGRVVDLLNENEQLKHDATVLIQANQDYRKENEQLKSICQDHHDHANDFKADCVRLEKENEQLKSEIKDLNDILARYEEKELKG